MKDEFGKIIANNIRAERSRNDYSQEEVSNKLGISKRTYLKYEENASKISAIFLANLSLLFKCKIDSFFVGIDFTKCE